MVGRCGELTMKKLILTLFVVALASSPLLAENSAGKTETAQSQIGKTGKHKKHKKSAKKHANKKKSAASKTATA